MCLDKTGSKVLNKGIFKELPSHQKLWKEMFNGGVKDSTNNKYIEKYVEFLKTMVKLNMNDLMYDIPVNTDLIYVYITDCVLRKRSNKWDTIRNKLRGLDYVNQICGFHTSWSDDLNIQICKKWIQKNNPSHGSKIKPLRRLQLKIIYNYLLYQLDENFIIFCEVNINNINKIYDTKLNYKWSCLVTWIMVCATGGFRIGELVHPDDLTNNKYGIIRKDLRFGYIDNEKNITFDNNRQDRDKLFVIEITLRNSKTKKKNESIKVWMGRTHYKIDPIIMLFDLYYGQKSIYKNIRNNSYLFLDETGIPITIAQMRNMFAKIINEIGFIDKKFFTPHCLRKTYNITLSRCGVSEGLIAYGGRWKLAQAYFRYAIYSKSDLVGLAKIFWCSDDSKGLMIDIDAKVGYYFMRHKK